MEPREVVRCTFADCKLIQFRPGNSLCRRCHRPLDTEEAVRPGPIPVDHPLVDPATEAGLKVAGQVKEIRRARHLSQRQLAGRMQVPRTYISKIENGKAIPTLGSLQRLAEALGGCAPVGPRRPQSPRRRGGIDPGRSVSGRDCRLASKPRSAAPLAGLWCGARHGHGTQAHRIVKPESCRIPVLSDRGRE